VIQFYLRGRGKPTDVSRARAKLTLLPETEKQEIELMPAADRIHRRTPRPAPTLASLIRLKFAGKCMHHTG
jgi:hypothetical protein